LIAIMAGESFRAVDPYGHRHRGRWTFTTHPIFARVMLAENPADLLGKALV